MGIEEKAKAYDEALERFKLFKEKYYTRDTNLGDVIFDKTGEMQKDFETIFPELRESEDERIRRTLVEYFGPQAQLDFIRGVPIQKIRDWLEKQKENPKNTDSIPVDCASNAKCEDRSLKHTDSFGTDIRDTPAYWRGWDDAMKQKEQKPAEKQDYSGLTDLERAIHWGFLSAGVENVPVTIIKDTAKECLAQINPIIAVDTEQLLKILPQKSAWSEEDEMAFGDLMWCIEQARKSAKDENDMGNIWFAENWVKNKLKSLRPSWKPSEEQMEALQCAIAFMEIRKASDYDISPLKDLYEQLKKL